MTKSGKKRSISDFSISFAAAKAWKVAELSRRHAKIVYVTPDVSRLQTLAEDVNFFVGENLSVSFPAWDCLPFEMVSPNRFISAHRINSLLQLQERSNWVLIVSPESLVHRVIPPSILAQGCLTIAVGETFSKEAFVESLRLIGFSPCSRVTALGDLTVRGEVIDFFPSTSESPVRIEFFEDEIERIRLFNSETQRSNLDLRQISISPIAEIIPKNIHGLFDSAEVIANIRRRANELEVPSRELEEICHNLASADYLPGEEHLIGMFLSQKLPTINSLYGAEATVIFDDPIAVEQRLDYHVTLLQERIDQLSKNRVFHAPLESMYLSTPEINQLNSSPVITFNALNFDDTSKKTVFIPNYELKTALRYGGSKDGFKPFSDFVSSKISQGQTVILVVPTQARVKQLQHVCESHGLSPALWYEALPDLIKAKKRTKLFIICGQLSSGVQIPELDLVIVADEEIFSNRSERRGVKKLASARKILSTLNQIADGDLVVHIDYGIGRYQGLVNRTVDGNEGDFLEIQYADSTLLIPVQMIGKVQRYSSPTEDEPKLDKLSSTRWSQIKEKVRQEVAALAGDLLNLYAKRSIVRGWRYDPMGAEDERFAESFPYDETPDQMRAIEDVLKDMASEKPMDRLVCGDVGFGKTEVAIRAAFKCIQHARQVVVLAPTTVLAEQLARTFRARFMEEPVSIGIVSRFYSGRANKATLDEVKEGKIDILIGTHRVLSRDTAFKDLGLVIIDEEHRFGVQQKERLKSLKTSVDILTLTATPIPRTLNMSLIGIRDVSVIATPPPRRQVIKTFVAEARDSLIKDAIHREISRGGQVFFLFNRVATISLMTSKIRELIPHARIEFGHGSMKEKDLEDLMSRFVAGKFDILVSTTIIESGLDIPAANTIIIYDAHRYGMAQLYQLRGRVGRGDRQAYAYFMTPSFKTLAAPARERLKQFAAMDHLGIGFEMAMRDLEIRGAGNLLGKEQSGHVHAIGFELYSKTLKEALEHLNGDPSTLYGAIDPEVKLQTIAFIPPAFIPDISERLILYQRLAALWSEEEARELREEIEDRFGRIPYELESLIVVMRIRALLRRKGAICLERSGGANISITLSPDAPFDLERIMKLSSEGFRLTKNLSLICPELWVSDSIEDLETLFSKLEFILDSISSN